MTEQQPEALRLADIVERLNVGVHSQAIAEEYTAAARELRRLYADNEALKQKISATQPAAQDAVPMQPVVLAANGCVRFKENRIVSALLDHGEKTGYSMNDIARGDFTGEERMQMAQLIGYSVSGYGDLSYASRESVAKAGAEAEVLAAQAKQDK